MIPSPPIRVLIVDDSAVTRRWLRSGLESQDGIEVVGTAGDPFEAHDAIFRLRPDVVTLDVEMPKMDGLTFLAKLMRHFPMPVVIHSSVTPLNSANAMTALSLGAVDVVPKPRNAAENASTLGRLVKSVRTGARSRPRTAGPPPSAAARISAPGVRGGTIRAIAIASSTGGPQALETILGGLAAGFPCILIVQHLPVCFVEPLAERLNRLSAGEVKVARGGEILRPGLVLIAPGDRHLSLGGGEPRIRLTDGPKVNFHRPSADVLFRGVARSLGPAAVGIVLTGMGRDGAAGLSEMHRSGAHTIAEAESTCVVYGMPAAAVESGGVSEVAPLPKIAGRLAAALDRTSTAAPAQN